MAFFGDTHINLGSMREAVASSIAKRLLATATQTPEIWRTEVATRALVMSRGPLAKPYFSSQVGVWLLCAVYEAHVLYIVLSVGWRGAEILVAPGLLLLLLGRAFERPFQLESLSLNDDAAAMTVTGLEGTERTSKCVPYTRLRRASLVHVPARGRYQSTINQVVLYDLHDQVVVSIDVGTTDGEQLLEAIAKRLPANVVSTRVVA